MDEAKREAVEAAVFRRLVEHLQSRSDVQNIEMMTTAGFCRNCLGDWYKEAAEGLGQTISKEAARERIYGMPQAEWKAKYQRDATPEQLAAFEKSQKHG
ncbi:MAG: DUF1244 domain-containing protein [Alphaproteobacteria bacterium]|nr:DUF1244 domain-containing protein [Alphaproteobacteria bacterium]